MDSGIFVLPLPWSPEGRLPPLKLDEDEDEDEDDDDDDDDDEDEDKEVCLLRCRRPSPPVFDKSDASVERL